MHAILYRHTRMWGLGGELAAITNCDMTPLSSVLLPARAAHADGVDQFDEE